KIGSVQRIARRISVVGPVGGGSRSVAMSATRALGRLGHDVRFVDNAKYAPDLDAIRSSPDPEVMKTAMLGELFKMAASSTRDELLSWRPDVAIYLAQAPVLSEGDTAPLHAAGVTTVFWFVEDFR